jgi:diadenosine tetraphosphate (Ap4A) HIT family hydrolase
MPPIPTKHPVDLASLRPGPGSCFICKFIDQVPGYEHVTVYETDTAIAFLNKIPTLFGYILIAPKSHLEQVTGSFTQSEYLDLQQFIYQVSEAVRIVLQPERVYILSLGSQSANAHVHWHIASLPHDVPLEEQQYNALMHENGAIETNMQEMEQYAKEVRDELRRVQAIDLQ